MKLADWEKAVRPVRRARKAATGVRRAWKGRGRHRAPGRAERPPEMPRKAAPPFDWADCLVWLVVVVSFAALFGVVRFH